MIRANLEVPWLIAFVLITSLSSCSRPEPDPHNRIPPRLEPKITSIELANYPVMVKCATCGRVETLHLSLSVRVPPNPHNGAEDFLNECIGFRGVCRATIGLYFRNIALKAVGGQVLPPEMHITRKVIAEGTAPQERHDWFFADEVLYCASCSGITLDHEEFDLCAIEGKTRQEPPGGHKHEWRKLDSRWWPEWWNSLDKKAGIAALFERGEIPEWACKPAIGEPEKGIAAPPTVLSSDAPKKDEKDAGETRKGLKSDGK